MKGKIIILSAPSGSGKSTIISYLLKDPSLNLGFSVSATSRSPRGAEKHGIDYFFLSDCEFKKLVAEGKFVEWEEVYQGTCYGTLESEVKRVTDSGKNLIMDVDVKGALNIKKKYGENALSLFIEPPSMEVLEQRLHSRGTDSEETIKKRLDKAKYELSFAREFDKIIVNDNLESAVAETLKEIKSFIGI